MGRKLPFWLAPGWNKWWEDGQTKFWLAPGWTDWFEALKAKWLKAASTDADAGVVGNEAGPSVQLTPASASS